MAGYDGSVRIGTEIDTKGFKDGEKEIEAESQRMAESVSKAVEKDAKQIEKDIENLKDAQKSFLEAGGKKTSPVYQEYEKELAKLQNSLQSLQKTQDDTEIADEHWNQLKIDVEEYAKSLKELQDQGKFFGDEDYDKIYVAWKNATDAVKAYQAELNKQTESGQAKIAEQEAKAAEKKEAAQRRAEEQAEKALQKENARIQKEIDNQAKLEAKEAERKAKEEARLNAIQAKEEAKRAKEVAAIQAQEQEEQRLDQIRVNAVASNDQIIAKVERLKQLEQEIADLKNVNRTEGYADYDNRIKEASKLRQDIREYNNELTKTPEKFEKMRKSANKAFTAIAQGTKKGGGLLSTFSSRLKGIALSLLIFNWISKGFNAMVSGIKKGFENLAGYSDSYAQNIQNMKNAMSTLGNQFAAAFAPIVQMVIPWLNRLIGVLTTAMTYVSQFIAVLSGKGTFTRAKKVQDDYNKSLGGTAKAADKARGALSKFDDLDVLEKKEDTSDGGVGTKKGGANMFEEVPIDTEVLGFWQRVQEAIKLVINYAKQLKDIFAQGFFDGLGDWGGRWESVNSSILSIKESLMNIFTDPAVLGATNSWAQSVAYTIGSIAGSISSIGLTIAENLFGGIEIFLDENKEQIKEKLISMFDVREDINYLIASFSESFAYVFEAFGGENGQQLTANLIGIFANSFLELGVIVGELARDILNIIIKPFTDNKEEFRTALDGFLGVFSEVTSTIKQGIENTFYKFDEIYNKHLKPFFDSIAQGLSDTAGKFMEFWNGSVQPILDGWAEGFDEMWQEHIQPMLNNFMELLGKVADFLKVVWEKILKPLIDWIIENILPVILPIIDGIGKKRTILF